MACPAPHHPILLLTITFVFYNLTDLTEIYFNIIKTEKKAYFIAWLQYVTRDHSVWKKACCVFYLLWYQQLLQQEWYIDYCHRQIISHQGTNTTEFKLSVKHVRFVFFLFLSHAASRLFTCVASDEADESACKKQEV